MSNADKIRAAMSATHEMTAAEITEATGVALNAVCQFLNYGFNRFEVIKFGNKQPHTYLLNPDYKPGTKGKLNKPEIAKRVVIQMSAAGSFLRRIVRENVDGWENNEDIVAALDMQERAEELARAVV